LYSIHYKEGGMVEKGQLLFTIDSREYKATADAAEADANRAEARVSLAHQELKRAEELIGERAISQGELDQRRMESQQAEADVLAARANAERAKLDLGFTYIRAPFKGRAGEAKVKPGNLVEPGQTVLTTLASVTRCTSASRATSVHTSATRNWPARATARVRATCGTRCWSDSPTRTAPPHKGEMGLRRTTALNPDTGFDHARRAIVCRIPDQGNHLFTAGGRGP
jgi:multidrug efflux pump subunit AcrA (membrane-fusion protein)